MAPKRYSLDFSDMSGGKNSAFPSHAIAKNQCAKTLNAIHEKIGISKAPGYSGFNSTKFFDAVCTGFFTYLHDDGTETLIAISDGKVYSINTVTAVKTEIGTMVGPGECYAVNMAGNLWVVNGTSFIKIEDDLNVYQVQIDTPVTGTAAALAGGSLSDGVYDCYVSYARVDANGRYLYSLPESLGTVTLGSGNNTVRVTLTESDDPQVNRIVVFLTDAGGVVPYYYGEVTEPTATTPTATIDISTTTDRNENIKMAFVAASNIALPITPSGIYTADDRLYVWDIGGKEVFWSLKTDVNPFDLERFISQNKRTMPYSVNSIFALGDDLFFNHTGIGISVAYYGDMTSIIKLIQKRLWYLDCKTQNGKSNVVEYKGVLFGLTNDGFRLFDGLQFGEDVSYHIKPDIDNIYLGSSKLPCAVVIRRSGKRTEYRFSYCNTSYGTLRNNDQRVFNLDYFFDPYEPLKTWECWENGFTYVDTVDGNLFGVQNGVSDAQVIYEHGVSDINCYNRTGSYQTVTFVKQTYILTRTYIDALNVINIWGPVCGLATSCGTINGNIILFDENNTKYGFEIVGVPTITATLPSDASGLGIPLPFILGAQYPMLSTMPMPFGARSNTIALELSHTENDTDFFLYKVQLPTVTQEINNIS